MDKTQTDIDPLASKASQILAMQVVLELITNKWSLMILAELCTGAQRFNALKRLLGKRITHNGAGRSLEAVGTEWNYSSNGGHAASAVRNVLPDSFGAHAGGPISRNRRSGPSSTLPRLKGLRLPSIGRIPQNKIPETRFQETKTRFKRSAPSSGLTRSDFP